MPAACDRGRNIVRNGRFHAKNPVTSTPANPKTATDILAPTARWGDSCEKSLDYCRRPVPDATRAPRTTTPGIRVPKRLWVFRAETSKALRWRAARRFGNRQTRRRRIGSCCCASAPAFIETPVANTVATTTEILGFIGHSFAIMHSDAMRERHLTPFRSDKAIGLWY